MKKTVARVLIGAFIVGLGCIGGSLLMSYSAPPASTGCVGGSYFNVNTVYPVWTGKYDTVAATATDTIILPLSCAGLKSVTFTNNVLKTAGSPTVTVTLYGSADGGASYGTTALTSYTAAPTSTVTPVTNTYIVNGAGGGNPMTHYMWVLAGTASSTASWKSTVLPRQ
jgi:hypothetical protein